jgi:hypothetical protein
MEKNLIPLPLLQDRKRRDLEKGCLWLINRICWFHEEIGDLLDYIVRLIENLNIRKSKYVKTEITQEQFTIVVGVHLLVVNFSIYFDDQIGFETGEIDDKLVDWALAQEFVATHLPSTQPLPKQVLGRCRCMAHFTGSST